MVQFSNTLLPVLSSTVAFAEVANVESEVTKVNFGEYSGSYEGDISTFVPTMGNAKQRSSQLGHKLTPELRRYSHLKLMISYIMGSGAVAARYTDYGCHCSLGPDVTRTHAKVPAQDNLDEICRRQTMCLHCAKIDNGNECEGGKKGYSFSGHFDEDGKRYIKCLNTPGTCRHALCLCDAALAEGLRDYGDDWSQDLHRDWGSFNFNKKCAANPQPILKPTNQMAPQPPAISESVHYNSKPQSEPYRQQYQSDIDSDFAEPTTTLAPTTAELITALGGNGGLLGDPQFDSAKTGNFEFETFSGGLADQGMFSAGTEIDIDHGPSTQCCGEYPERFPYKNMGANRKCCGSTTFNPSVMECCSGNDIRNLGMC